ncbi:transmembrane 220 family protein [Robertkochia aurantiaca]|uniref:transmembrane 220 family protein n=1 Tax=Robertkochia aurantiaca TaxID=2873700 RepID=UPI001CCF0C75|nr:transmembrane 220 family protein [Robertkochia sp. 3YJGBD-33]
MKLLFKTLALIFALLFIWSAFLQHNDPDPLLWYGIYLLAAVLSILFVFDRLPVWLVFMVVLLFLIAGVMTWPETFEGVTIGQGDIKNIEEGREALGLLFTALILGMFGLRVWYIRKGSRP